MFRCIKARKLPPCRVCVNCISLCWENLFGGFEEELRCRIKSNTYGDYYLCSMARGSKQCKYKEGTPSIVNDV